MLSDTEIVKIKDAIEAVKDTTAYRYDRPYKYHIDILVAAALDAVATSVMEQSPPRSGPAVCPMS